MSQNQTRDLRAFYDMQGLKVAYDVLIGSTFEELLRQADVAEVLAQGTTGSNHTPSSRAAKTSDIVLLKRPRVFNLAIGWESAQVSWSSALFSD